MSPYHGVMVSLASSTRCFAARARWAWLALCVLLGVAWWCSRVWTVDVRVTKSFGISLSQSALRIVHAEPQSNTLPASSRVWVYRVLDPDNDIWQPQYIPQGIPPTSRTLLVPIWILLALAMVPTGLLWRAEFRAARRRRLVGHCMSCGYNRAGLNVDAMCPECGAHA